MRIKRDAQVGSAASPPVYPTRVRSTPGISVSKRAWGCQNQPSAMTATSPPMVGWAARA